MKRVTHTSFAAPTTVIGRDVDITLAITNGLAKRAEREARKARKTNRRTVNTTVLDLDASDMPGPIRTTIGNLAVTALEILSRWGVDVPGYGKSEGGAR